nr:GNAT family N-acetyltransferase [Motiliproteus sediminis]
MLAADELRAAPEVENLVVSEIVAKQFPFNRFLYQLVGGPWQWTDKLDWSDAQWRKLVEADQHRTFVAYRDGAIAGYYELQRDGAAVEILYFGLAPQFIGQGLGGYLLSHALRSAWGWPGTQRVWVHTCDLDHPAALANYQRRGLKIYQQTTE